MEVVAVTGLPEAFLRNRVPRAGPRLTFHDARFDLGMVQVDSVRVDVPESLRQVRALLARAGDLTAGQARWLERGGFDLVVSDIPALPVEAAARAGIPSIATSNFSWAWIYEGLAEQDPAWREIAETFARSYRMTGLLLRMPFAEEMTVFPHRRDVGLLARPGRRDRDRLAALTGADPARRWVLLSFTTLDWDAAALREVSALRDLDFFTILPLRWDAPNLHPVDRESFAVPDLFASVDAVVTKPGYGVVSECVANDLPVVHVDRDHFRETPVLQRAIARHLRHAFLPPDDLYAGRIGPYIEAALACPPPPDLVPRGGDLECARAMLETRR
ncbi:MAG: hypothetical protein U1F77_18060 [Kiritimatiellia bacterium]